jgi:transglutaminase-like putative cysteine protease
MSTLTSATGHGQYTTTPGGRLRSTDRLGIATALAMVLASFTVLPLTSDRAFLGSSWLLIALIAGVGIALRRLRLGPLTVTLAQVVVLVAYLFVLVVSMPGESQGWSDHLENLIRSGIEHMQTQSAPMDPNDGVKLMIVSTIGVLMVILDVLAIGLNRPAWALLPTATVFAVPAVGLGADTGVVSFACIAIGYLGILVADGFNMTARWTRGLSRDSADGYGTANPVVWRAAGLIGAPALVATVVLAVLLPTFTLPGGNLGAGVGGGGPLQLADPTLDLRRNLNQPRNAEVLRYESDSPSGQYLRMASLPRFSAAGWGNVPMRLTDGNSLGQIPGLNDSGMPRQTTSIRILDFGSEYLPLPYAPRSFTAAGPWAYDPNSLMVLSTTRTNRIDSTRNLSYTVQSVDITPDPNQFARAGIGNPADADYTKPLPNDFPQSLRLLATQITADARTPVDKAAAIQSYLRSSRFTYNTDPQPGSGYQALENFLLRDRTGYCEQFAASMAVLARAVGIPSRVAVGFLPGKKVSGNTWSVSIHDMHAWPELFFAGFGWVRYEPTPASVTGSAPTWTLESSEQPTGPTSNEPSISASASAGTSAGAPTNDVTDTGSNAGSGSTSAGGRTALMVVLGIVGLLVLAAPATLRVRRRSARLSTDAPPVERIESAWAEIRDSVADYGGAWPDGESPRQIGREIGGRLGPDESAAMGQVASLVEQSRYARAFDDADGTRRLATMTKDVRRGLARPQSRWRRFWAAVLPRSLFRRR